MKKISRIALLGLIAACCLMGSCAQKAYVNQQQQTYHDYKAIKHSKVVNKTRNSYPAGKRNK